MYLRHTRQLDFNGLHAFLAGQAAWSPEAIQTIGFLDHVMREWPSQQYTQIKKSFFQRGEQRFDLGGGVEAFKGVFASLRPVLDDKFKKSLSVNVDVANGTFWRAQDLIRAMTQVFNCSAPQLVQRFREAKPDWKNSRIKRDLRVFRRVGVSTTHTKEPTHWTIDDVENMDANEAKFPDPDDRSKSISVAKYFKTKYNMNLQPGMFAQFSMIERADIFQDFLSSG
jgi:eukaryotic translation initiation factor 2C